MRLVLFSCQRGIGVDQVVAFQLISENSTSVLADGCSNPDLFWALRGGGVGTFSVVTHVCYKLHPVTPIMHILPCPNSDCLLNTGQFNELFN
jgi:FAD/FMN-containing dehydrogenase